MENKNKNTFWLFFITFLTSFILGILFSLQVDKILNYDLLKSNNLPSIYSNEENLNLTKFWTVYDIIKSEYFDSKIIDNNKLLESSISWLVNWLWDKHSNYLNIEENKNFNESLAWDFEWIWAVVEPHPMGVSIDMIIKWSPAKNSDLRSWDLIIKSNDISLEWLTLVDAVNNIKWPAWTKVILEIIREWEKNIIKKELTREKIKIPSVDFEKFDNNTWYISINMFWDETSLEFQKAITELKDTSWLIIDLRDNWWGYLLSAVEILSNLIENWEILVVTKYSDENTNEVYKSINSWEIYKWKIIILINENSASASEITAWALKEYQKAIVVWKKSYGKWSVQEPFELGDWSMLKLTVAKWFTPKWVNIDQDWIIPDVEISFLDEDYKNAYDRQKEEAKKILDTFIKTKALNLTIDSYKEQNK